MSESILAAFFDADTGGGSGESGSLVNFATPGDDMFVLMLRAIMDDVANQINHYIIPQLIDYNFDGGKYPTFTWGTFTDEQRSAIAATFDKLATSGQSMNVSEEFMRELEKTQAKEMGLEIDWELVEAREAEEKAVAAAQFAGGGVGPDGQPLPGAAPDPALAGIAGAPGDVTNAELGGAQDLTDVLGIMAKKADKAAGAGSSTPPPADPALKAKKTVKLSGITDDMFDWALQMVGIAGEDYSDG